MLRSQFDDERIREAKEHAAAIISLVGQAEGLIAQVRQLVASICEHEAAASLALVASGNFAHTGKFGQTRLAQMVLERMSVPAGKPLPAYCEPSIAAIADKAWSELLEGRL